LDKLDEENLGFLFQMKMIEIILLAKLMKVDAFEQPGVELYKIETSKILQK
jgi:glucose-6-phosphate isomerase